VAVKVLLASTTIVHIHFAEGAKSRPTILLDSRTKNLPQVNWHVLLHCTNKACYTKY